MSYQLFVFPENEVLGEELLQNQLFRRGAATIRRFPDGESYVRLETDVKDQRTAILCTLFHPDEKILPLYFLTRLLRQKGARSVTLIAPYLAYMRQDKVFQPGEAVTSDLFAVMLNGWVDALITIDPHLHRHGALSEIYSIPALVLHAGSLIADYIQKHIEKPLIIGPDEESDQWAGTIAHQAGCPYLILQKERLGDRRVQVSAPDAEKLSQYTPVLIDDIISTARTMIETVKRLQAAAAPPPVCIGIHGIFAGDAWQALKNSGVAQIITTNTIPHPSNDIDVSDLVLEQIERL